MYENVYHNYGEGFKIILNPSTRILVSAILFFCLYCLREYSTNRNVSKFVINFALTSSVIIVIVDMIIYLTWVLGFIF